MGLFGSAEPDVKKLKKKKDIKGLFEAASGWSGSLKAVEALGEIGGSQEEEVAEVIKDGRFTKPIVIYIAGVATPEGQRFSHASAIVERGRGSVQGKVKALRKAGTYPVETPKEILPTESPKKLGNYRHSYKSTYNRN